MARKVAPVLLPQEKNSQDIKINGLPLDRIHSLHNLSDIGQEGKILA